MAKQSNIVFLEELLRSSSYSNVDSHSRQLSSARAIIQAWSELREALQNKSFHSTHLHSLQLLLNSQYSLHVADLQAKLLISLISSPNLSIPHHSYPLFFGLLYIWVRKSFKPSALLIDSAVEAVSGIFSVKFDYEKTPFVFSKGILLLGAFSFVPYVSKSSKTVCLELLCRLVEPNYPLMHLVPELIPDVLAGMGYALSSADVVVVHFYSRIFYALLGIWGKEDGPPSNVTHGLMILHLIEWLLFGFLSSRSGKQIDVFSGEMFNTLKEDIVAFVRVMAAAGVLRACNRSASSGLVLEIVSRLRISSEEQIESVARELLLKSDLTKRRDNFDYSLLLQCISLALARSGTVSPRIPLLVSLMSALLDEIFPLRRLYEKVLEFPQGSLVGLRVNEVKEHINSIPFKEAGTITSVFCKQYAMQDEDVKYRVENQIWSYCEDIYSRHRQVALVLRGREDGWLLEMEKIAESAFLMVVVFASAVTKHRLNSKYTKEIQMQISVRILVSFSCMEYFRRMRLPEYMDTIRGVVISIQENNSACVSFVESMPSYADLTNPQDFSFRHKMDYVWSKDEVQTSRILFYLRVIPTCIEHLPLPVFRRVVAPTMFLYIGHPNGKVARASHSMFVSFTSSGNDTNQDDRELLKEQLVFYYVQRSLAGYPGITPSEAMSSGVAALVRHLPAGSPAIFYCIKCLVEKANTLCSLPCNEEAHILNNWQEESEACKKILELLVRLISLVDIQVLPYLMKLSAELIVQLPKPYQHMVLNELYTQVAESDDITRKPTLVSWLQSLSYLCSQATAASDNTFGTNSLRDAEVNARL